MGLPLFNFWWARFDENIIMYLCFAKDTTDWAPTLFLQEHVCNDLQTPVVQTAENFNQRISRYPRDKMSIHNYIYHVYIWPIGCLAEMSKIIRYNLNRLKPTVLCNNLLNKKNPLNIT